MEFKPSYEVYRQILSDIKASGKLCDYKEAMKRDSFIILRHDIEFSPERAYKMSQIESEMNITSTYFVQLKNDSYNALSKRNIDLFKDMKRRGHRIGFHFHLCGEIDPEVLKDECKNQLHEIRNLTGFDIDVFSYHRPVAESLYYSVEIPGVINAYGPKFFSYRENVKDSTILDVKYIADSKHQWNYGFPDAETFRKYPKIQILIHPFSWSEDGLNNGDNFRSLLDENTSRIIATYDDEFKRFSEDKDKILSEFEDRKFLKK